MKKLSLMFCLGALLALCACNGNEKAAKELLVQLQQAQNQKNVEAIKRLYPGAEGVESLYLNFDVEKLTFTQLNDTLVSDDGAGHIVFFSTQNSDSITIINSRGLFIFPEYRMKFAKGTGQYKKGIPDVELAKRMNDKAFDDYVLQNLRLKYANPLGVGGQIYDDYGPLKWYILITNHSDIMLRSTDYDLQYTANSPEYSYDYEEFSIKKRRRTEVGKDIAPGQTVRYIFYDNDTESYDNFSIRYHISDITLMENFQPTGKEYEEYLAANGGVPGGKNQAKLVGHKTLKGVIGKYAVNGTLDFTPDNTFTGTYGYSGQTSGVNIKGTITINGEVVASETDAQGNVSGNYHGRVVGNTISGQFTNYKGQLFDFTWNIR